MEVPKSLMTKNNNNKTKQNKTKQKSKEDEQISAGLS